MRISPMLSTSKLVEEKMNIVEVPLKENIQCTIYNSYRPEFHHYHKENSPKMSNSFILVSNWHHRFWRLFENFCLNKSISFGT